jgi:pimeloyl-ACP methyl ester carboxylesterase
MPTNSPPRSPFPPRPKTPPRQPPNPQSRESAELVELVDPRFILKSLGAVFTVALILAYITLCVVFARSQWQFVLHPSREVAKQPDSYGLNFVEVHFGVDTTGEPQLDGWWLPSDTPTDPTVLLLHDVSGSMSDALPLARSLHDASLNVLVFDYRGFGHSSGQHPTQALMQADAETAYSYLTGTRGVPQSSVAVLGDRGAAALAVALCSQHPQIPALILRDADGDFEPRAAQDVRSQFVPVRWLFHEDFPLAAPLRTLATPKLLISTDSSSVPANVRQAADPKTTVELLKSDTNAMEAAISRFIGSYVAKAPSVLSPNP